MPPMAPPVAPLTTANVSTFIVRMNPACKRGVSWDFGAQIVPAASHSESVSPINRYKNEEEAAFATLGILQPILQDNDDGACVAGADEVLGEAMHLMQPILVRPRTEGAAKFRADVL